MVERKQVANGWERWRGATDERLKNIESRQESMAIDLTEVKTTSHANNVLLQQLVGNSAPEEKSSSVSFRWLAEKVGIPLLLGLNTIILGLVLAHVLGGS
jgi:hypothetical protein